MNKAVVIAGFVAVIAAVLLGWGVLSAARSTSSDDAAASVVPITLGVLLLALAGVIFLVGRRRR